MAELTSSAGPFRNPADTNGQIEFRRPEEEYLSVDELLELYHTRIQVTEERRKELQQNAVYNQRVIEAMTATTNEMKVRESNLWE